MRLVRDIWCGLLDLVYPPKCLVCGKMQPKYLCDACVEQIVYIDPPICRRCGAPLTEGRCLECAGAEFEFNSAESVGVYEGVLREAIHQFKYSRHRVLGPVLGGLLVEHMRSRGDLKYRAASIVPVPIHKSRLRMRGFNQSEMLAEHIGKSLSLPVLRDALLRSKPTRAQVDLPVEVRKENVHGVFQVKRRDAVSGRILLLIDDVYTTGSTADSAARALRAAGAEEIHVLTLARSV
ncbi:MAG: ComF family protein [Armatimonadetes bacterium]|nr:ComF family protein [Armatimonadota bacterium]